MQVTCLLNPGQDARCQGADVGPQSTARDLNHVLSQEYTLQQEIPGVMHRHHDEEGHTLEILLRSPLHTSLLDTGGQLSSCVSGNVSVIAIHLAAIKNLKGILEADTPGRRQRPLPRPCS